MLMNVNREAWMRSKQLQLGNFENISAFAVRKNYGIFTAHARLAVLVRVALHDIFNSWRGHRGAICLAFKISGLTRRPISLCGVSRGIFCVVRGRYKKIYSTSVFA
jgi:hypothetical protein